jgi:DNA-binding MarR family transcriptional regulator
MHLDDVVHQRVRLGILVALHNRPRVAFTELSAALAQPDSGTSRHLRVLEDAGLVVLEKVFADRRPRTWVSITDAGRRALSAEFAALRRVMAGIESGEGPDDGSPAFTMLLADDPAPPSLSYSHLVLDRIGEGFRLVRDAPVDEHFGMPDDVPEWHRRPQQALTFRSHGLRGGQLRGWARGRDVRVHILAVRLGTDEAPAALLDVFAASTLPLPGLGGAARGYLLQRPSEAFPCAAVCWLAHGPHLACVTTQATEALARDLGPGIAARQHEHLGEL